MTIQLDKNLPAVADLVPYVTRLHEATGATLAEAPDAAVERVLLERDATDTGWASSVTVTVAAVVVTWTWESFSRGPRSQAVTLTQIITGYRTGGEGSVTVDTYACRGRLTAGEASTFARIVSRGGSPALVESREV